MIIIGQYLVKIGFRCGIYMYICGDKIIGLLYFNVKWIHTTHSFPFVSCYLAIHSYVFLFRYTLGLFLIFQCNILYQIHGEL